jgi:hypothetical protein
MLVPVFVLIGAIGNTQINTGILHGAAVTLVAIGFPAAAFALWGMRARHGGLGTQGRIAFWLFGLSPVLSAPCLWAAIVAFVVYVAVSFSLLGNAVARAGVLPRVPALTLGFAPLATVIAAIVAGPVVGRVAIVVVPVGIAVAGVALAWLGLAMWREPALDARAPSGRGGPLAAT